MKYSVVRLEPFGPGTFKAPLRSDTIWNALCWSIRLVYGNDQLNSFLHAYDEDSPNALFISSAFPFVKRDNNLEYFLPAPLHLPPSTEPPSHSRALDPVEVKKVMRKRKKEQEKGKMLSQSLFEYRYCEGPEPDLNFNFEAPKVKSQAFTHNTIDRLTGGTLNMGDSGQLYHTNEYYLDYGKKGEKIQAGFYFLVSGPLEKWEGALRFLEHFGIGGDRSIGKGRFKWEWDDPEIREPGNANACMTLSLYRPTGEELNQIEKAKGPLTYEIDPRQGRRYSGKENYLKDGKILFREGSVFPLEAGVATGRGANEIVGKHEDGHNLLHYGKALMTKVKIPSL